MNAEKTADNIARWLRDYAANYGKRGYVVGLSGGVDSAVATALAVQGVGKDNVFAMLLPCYTDEDDDRLGAEVAGRFGIAWERVNLGSAYTALMNLHRAFETGPVDVMARIRLAEANIKPRLRMIMLYYIASAANCLVLGTGNRSEHMLGYFTKYGDGGVDVEPLGQLYKTEVWELAKYLGVPQEVIDRPPSAGLWPGQTDQEEIGYSYHAIDAALKGGLHPGDPIVKRVLAMREVAQHKLHMPPLGPEATS